MCGRYSLYTDPEALAEHFELDAVPRWTARYNIAPSPDILAIGLTREGQRRASHLRWGLVPAWAHDASIGHKMINARAETVADKPAFRRAFREHRCLVPADGFFEWKRTGKTREPWYIRRRDGRPMAFAGLWERWTDRASGERIASCAIITTAANGVLAPIHDRMPVILEREAYAAWLDGGEELQSLLEPADDAVLEAYRVDARVNNPRHEDPDCIRPLKAEN